jgi:hypothetical protein
LADLRRTITDDIAIGVEHRSALHPAARRPGIHDRGGPAYTTGGGGGAADAAAAPSIAPAVAPKIPAAIVEPSSAAAGRVEAAMLPLRIIAATPPAMTLLENAFIQLLLSKGRPGGKSP